MAGRGSTAVGSAFVLLVLAGGISLVVIALVAALWGGWWLEGGFVLIVLAYFAFLEYGLRRMERLP